MAIFLASTKPISRSNGQSAVASASYRAGVELEDKRYNKTHDYSKKSGVMSADIILPTALREQGASIDRGELWNLAESSETRKNSRVAREWLINLPHELDDQTRKDLAHTFAQALADKFDVIADCAIHKPTDKEIARGADHRNFHAHIMITTRKAELGDDGKITLTSKSDCELSDTQRKAKDMSRARDEVKEIRQLWEKLANDKLVENGHELIDSRSYKDRGLDIEPQLKMGSVATKRERDNFVKVKSKRIEKSVSKEESAEDKAFTEDLLNKMIKIKDVEPVTVIGAINRVIAERNYLASTQIIFEQRRETKNDFSREHTGTATRAIDGAAREINLNSKLIENTASTISKLTQSIDRNSQAIERTKQAIDESINFSEHANSSINKVAEYSSIRARTHTQAAAPDERDSYAKRDQRIRELTRTYERFSEQERRVNSDTRANDHRIERHFDAAERLKKALALRLIRRNTRENVALYDSEIIDYPNKFDSRQSKRLNDFAMSIRIEKQSFSEEYLSEVTSKLTSDNLKNNESIIKLLKSPKAERQQYLENKQDFEKYKAKLDNHFNDINTKNTKALGSIGNISAMTAKTLTASGYIDHLDQYINDSSKHDDARDAAREHRDAKINETARCFKVSYENIHNLPANTQETHSDALRASLNDFTSKHSQKLNEEHLATIESGLSVYNHYEKDPIVSSSHNFRP